ncbi:hypothetical protein, partial [Desulforamulus aquiferis]
YEGVSPVSAVCLCGNNNHQIPLPVNLRERSVGNAACPTSYRHANRLSHQRPLSKAGGFSKSVAEHGLRCLARSSTKEYPMRA